jgi:predicted MPP superfamily phosphohydrolase
MFRFILVASSILLALDFLWWWCADRFARSMRHRRAWRLGWAAFMLVQAIGMTLLMFARYIGLDRTAGLPLEVLIFLFVWHLLVLPGTVVIAVLVATGWSITELIARLRRMLGTNRSSVEPVPVTAAALTRRQFLAGAVVTVPPLVTMIGSARAIPQSSRFRVRRLAIPLVGLPRDLDGLTIAQVSDVHVGDFTFGPTLRRIVEETNALKPDLVLMSGDLINRRLADLPAAMDMVRQFDPKHGVYLCEGNHDLFEGREAFASGVRGGGGRLLVDSSDIVRIAGHPVQLLGLQWGPRRHGGSEVINASMDRLLTQRQPDAFPILLAHHPHAFDRAVLDGIPLTLAGHTHGGQLHLTPGIGFGPMMFKYWSGLYRRNDSALVVSNGVGNWFPLRLNAPAEIVHITLRRA